MKLTSFKYFSYELIFNNEFITSKGKTKRRKVFFIELKDENGKSFLGEVAPLPQFNSESFDKVESELNKISRIQTFECKETLNDVLKYVNSLSSFSTIKFALEQIFISCLFNIDKNKSAAFPVSKEIKVNALMGIDDFETSQNKLKQFIAQGYSVIKLKANDDNFSMLYDIISWAIDELKADLKFRIDPNCSWDMKKTILRSKKLEYFPIEYIEQPVKESTDLINLSFDSLIPIAADESMRNIKDVDKLVADSKIKFFVIKPMLFGGMYNLTKLLDLIKSKDIKIITSSSLESNVGRRHLVLSSSIIDNNLAHGLGTSEMFINQPTDDVYPVINGAINYSLNNYSSAITINLK